MMEYEIFLGGQVVGTARVERQGLYYRFDCRCRFSGEVVYRLCVKCGERTESLGIPVPKDGQFELQTRIPVKKIGEGPMEFKAVPKHGELGEKFIPLAPEEPFRYIRRLQDAVLQRRGDTVGVVLKRDVNSEIPI